MAIDVLKLLSRMPAKNASDLHLRVNMPPIFRIHGKLMPASRSFITKEDMDDLIHHIVSDRQRQKFDETWELDMGLNIPTGERFRVNIYRERGTSGIAFRLISNKVPSFYDLNLPRILQKLSMQPRGLILVTGVTGSGKSTTLAAMVDYINNNKGVNILTVEDPIEYLHTNRRSIIAQREIGSDCKSFSMGLRQALRQDPDVVLIGEMRDLETISSALTIAETGHLAFATLHTNSAAETINRIIDVFPTNQQTQVRVQLSFVLQAVLVQTLVPKIGGGRMVCVEIMTITPAIRAQIRDDKIHQLYSSIQSGGKYGMQTMNTSLAERYMEGYITLEDCMGRSPDPQELNDIITRKRVQSESSDN
jgi:twitching motility protein PilT